MDNLEKELQDYKNLMLSFHIPRWEELPNIDLYMDQVITFIQQSLLICPNNRGDSIITPSMVNNYVKLNLIPKPIKKKYNRRHLAYLIVISILKNIFTIQDIKEGILFQTQINEKKVAYNSFCEEQEKAIQFIAKSINSDNKESLEEINLTNENFVIEMATISFASKVFCQKTLELQNDFMENENSKEV